MALFDDIPDTGVRRRLSHALAYGFVVCGLIAIGVGVLIGIFGSP